MSDEGKQDQGNPFPPSLSRGSAVRTGQEENYDDYNVNDKVSVFDAEIGEIILRNNECLVFLDKQDNLRWLYKELPTGSAWLHARITELLAKCGFFEEAAKADHHSLAAKRFIGQGIVVLYSGGSKAEVEATLDNADKFIQQCGREVSLRWLYKMFGWLALGSFLVPNLFYLANTAFVLKGGKYAYFTYIWGGLSWKIFLCAAAGGIGAYISRALASRTDLPCDANAGKRLHYHEALLRWAVGVVAGGLIGLLIESKVLLGNLTGDADSNFSVTLALALIAGVSERFLPTLLKRFNDNVTKNEEAGAPPADGSEGDAKAEALRQAKTARAAADHAKSEAQEAGRKAEQDRKAADADENPATKPTKEEVARQSQEAAQDAQREADRLEKLAQDAEQAAK